MFTLHNFPKDLGKDFVQGDIQPYFILNRCLDDVPSGDADLQIIV